jgi:putative aminopeptidase FrvX
VKKWHEEVLRDLLSVPTAPFAEEAVVARVRQWAKRLGLTVGSDSVGNLLLRPRGARRGAARWFFAAHMDHPGFIVRSQRGRQIEADFIGTVRPEYFPKARVAFFRGMAVPAMCPTGVPPVAAGVLAPLRRMGKMPMPRLQASLLVRATVVSARPAPSGTHLLCRLTLAKDAVVPPGTIGMWDVPAFRVTGRRLSSRACDDVAGVASVLCAMGEIARRSPAADVTGLLTVAEEAGLVGATAACQARTIPPGALVVAIETSAAQPRAELGDGVVVRVGDRLWTFDPALTADIAAAAADLGGKDRAFRFTRQLMPGGVCESTAYCLWGHRAAGLCVPLGNYHNQGKGGRIAAEQIDLGDFESLVKLLAALPRSRARVGQAGEAIRKRLAGRVEAWRKVRG